MLKSLLADGREAYVGSANLTEYGMALFVEIEIVLKGRQVFAKQP
jgi:phosphatidylserine/phosphatidylglycerophosphate/cardiolipin synthase-like enzyme